MDDKTKKIVGLTIMIVSGIIGLVIGINTDLKNGGDGSAGIFMGFIIAFIPMMLGYGVYGNTEEEKKAKEFSYKINSIGNCPHCGSYKTYKISTKNRVVSIAAVGLASDKIGKQYGCHECGHKW